MGKSDPLWIRKIRSPFIHKEELLHFSFAADLTSSPPLCVFLVLFCSVFPLLVSSIFSACRLSVFLVAIFSVFFSSPNPFIFCRPSSWLAALSSLKAPPRTKPSFKGQDFKSQNRLMCLILVPLIDFFFFFSFSSFFSFFSFFFFFEKFKF